MQRLRAAGIDHTGGLSDAQQSLFFAPTQPVKGFILGAGSLPLFPAAIDDLLGSEKRGAGPTGVLLRQQGALTYRALAQPLMVLRRRRPAGPPPG